MAKFRTIAIWTLLAIPVIVVLVMIAVARGFAVSKKRINSANCANTIVSIGYGLRSWADDNGGKLPNDFSLASNEISSLQILVCPSDRKRTIAANWANFTATNSSYELRQGTFDTSDTNAVILRCQIHDHLGYVDGTVFDGEKRRSKRRL